VLPALLRRLLQQRALPEALALAKRHEGGPHFKRSLEWLLFTTLDMEGSKCKPGKAGAVVPPSDSGGWQQQPLHVLHEGLAGAAAGVLGRQGKVGPLGAVVQAYDQRTACCLLQHNELVPDVQPCSDPTHLSFSQRGVLFDVTP
jgi:hypothetical protein